MTRARKKPDTTEWVPSPLLADGHRNPWISTRPMGARTMGAPYLPAFGNCQGDTPDPWLL